MRNTKEQELDANRRTPEPVVVWFCKTLRLPTFFSYHRFGYVFVFSLFRLRRSKSQSPTHPRYFVVFVVFIGRDLPRFALALLFRVIVLYVSHC